MQVNKSVFVYSMRKDSMWTGTENLSGCDRQPPTLFTTSIIRKETNNQSPTPCTAQRYQDKRRSRYWFIPGYLSLLKFSRSRRISWIAWNDGGFHLEDTRGRKSEDKIVSTLRPSLFNIFKSSWEQITSILGRCFGLGSQHDSISLQKDLVSRIGHQAGLKSVGRDGRTPALTLSIIVGSSFPSSKKGSFSVNICVRSTINVFIMGCRKTYFVCCTGERIYIRCLGIMDYFVIHIVEQLGSLPADGTTLWCDTRVWRPMQNIWIRHSRKTKISYDRPLVLVDENISLNVQ